MLLDGSCRTPHGGGCRPISAGLEHRSASSRIRSSYSGVNWRRLCLGTTSGSDGAGRRIPSQPNIEIDVELEGGGLALSLRGGNVVLWPLTDSTFLDVEDGCKMRFSSGARERVELTVLGTLRATRREVMAGVRRCP